jgi:hypothetical protein
MAMLSPAEAAARTGSSRVEGARGTSRVSVHCWRADAAARIQFTVSILISKLAYPPSLV